MIVDIFYGTGFDIVNIPCNPEMLYTEFNDSYKHWTDVNIVQTDWLANITLSFEDGDDGLDWLRDADYVIVYDEAGKTRTCYTVDSYEMVNEDTFRLYLVLDPYNTAGGMEPVNGHQPMIVLGASANRISVPLEGGDPDQDFRQNEQDTFFVLDEPFSPSQRLHMHYDAVPYTPYVPPTPPVDPFTYTDFRYAQYNGMLDGRVVKTSSSATYTVYPITSVSNSSERSAAQNYINPNGSASGTYTSVTKNEAIDACLNGMLLGVNWLANQITTMYADTKNQKFARDLTGPITTFLRTIANTMKSEGEATSSNGPKIDIIPFWPINTTQARKIKQTGDGSGATIALQGTNYTNEFGVETLYYEIDVNFAGPQVPGGTGGGTRYFYLNPENGDYHERS